MIREKLIAAWTGQFLHEVGDGPDISRRIVEPGDDGGTDHDGKIREVLAELAKISEDQSIPDTDVIFVLRAVHGLDVEEDLVQVPAGIP